MSPTIQARAAAATLQLFELYGVYGIPPSSGKCAEVAAIIARHFADLEPLRAAAERAEKWFSAELVSRQGLVDLFGEDSEGKKYVTDIEDELAVLRAALTPDAAAGGTKGEK